MKIRQRTKSINGFLELYLKKATYHIEWKIYNPENKPQLVFNLSNIAFNKKNISSFEKESISIAFLKPKIKEYWINKIIASDVVQKVLNKKKKLKIIMWGKK